MPASICMTAVAITIITLLLRRRPSCPRCPVVIVSRRAPRSRIASNGALLDLMLLKCNVGGTGVCVCVCVLLAPAEDYCRSGPLSKPAKQSDLPALSPPAHREVDQK